MTEQQTIELTKLQGLAKKVEYYANPTMDQRQAIMFLAGALPETRCLSLPEIIKKDLYIYPVFTAIALWCDPDVGVGREYPEEVTRISQELFRLYGKKLP
jgi:hypothetical protein